MDGDPILQTPLHPLCHRHRLSDCRERDEGAVTRLLEDPAALLVDQLRQSGGRARR